jgi:hypothetical protein
LRSRLTSSVFIAAQVAGLFRHSILASRHSRESGNPSDDALYPLDSRFRGNDEENMEMTMARAGMRLRNSAWARRFSAHN